MQGNIRFVEGDMLDARQDFIVQQCNCVGTQAHGLSRHISLRFPYADPYVSRRKLENKNLAIPDDRPDPGTITVYGKENETKVVCAFAQLGMGKPGSYNNRDFVIGRDTADMRRAWFASCLDCIRSLHPKSVAFPHKIGCGMAGGNWTEHYLPAIRDFARHLPETEVVVIKRRGNGHAFLSKMEM